MSGFLRRSPGSHIPPAPGPRVPKVPVHVKMRLVTHALFDELTLNLEGATIEPSPRKRHWSALFPSSVLPCHRGNEIELDE